MKLHAIAGTTVLAVVLCSVARADNIKVRIDGDLVHFNGTQPRQIDGRVLVPLRGVFERLGATVDWIGAQNMVVATRGDTTIDLRLGSRTAMVNNQSTDLDVPAMAIGGHTMVPLRFVSEALGADVAWTYQTQTAHISTGGAFNAYRHTRAPRSPGESSIVPQDTVIPVRLQDRLSSNGSSPGDEFTAIVEHGQDDAGLPPGTQFAGVVREAIPARRDRPGVLSVDFRRIIMPDGASHDIDATLSRIDGKSVTRSSGRLVTRSNDRNERLKWVGIGAGAGLIISSMIGGDALIDSLLGGGAGYMFNETQRKSARNVILSPGRVMGVRLNQEFTYSYDHAEMKPKEP